MLAGLVFCLSWTESSPAEPVRKVADVDKIPVVVLSHGIGGNRFMYSHFASMLASHGVLVAAIEHTDGLGSAAKPAGSRCEL
jgi:predicted dienelactone hydrolase